MGYFLRVRIAAMEVPFLTEKVCFASKSVKEKRQRERMMEEEGLEIEIGDCGEYILCE